MRARAARLPVWVAPLALLTLLILINPRFYSGGGGDDWHYLEAARCAAEHGICLPANHWAARFPLVLPVAAAIALLGEREWSVALAPLLYATAAILLFVANVAHRFGQPAAILAGAALAMTPLLPFYALQPMVDLPEFAWILAALLAIQVAVERGEAGWAALAGAALALAMMTRTSTVALLPLLALGWLLLDPCRRWLALPCIATFAAVLGGEALAYAAATGDPLYGWRLSLHHSRIPTTELPAGIDLSRSPLLNLDFIRGWRRSMDIHIHWTIDPLLNLLADPLCGLTLCGALALGLARWRDWWGDRWLRLLAGAAALHFMLLTYVLAVDPKPRMFLFEIAIAATTLGVLGARAWRGDGRLVVAVLVTLLAGRAILMAYDQPNMERVRAVAAQWIATAPEGLAIDEWTRRTVTLIPAARALPPVETAPGRLRLILGTLPCMGGAVLREQRFDRTEWAPLAWLRTHRVLLGPQAPLRLCLVKPGPPRGGR